jgi:hypothetical protein
MLHSSQHGGCWGWRLREQYEPSDVNPLHKYEYLLATASCTSALLQTAQRCYSLSAVSLCRSTLVAKFLRAFSLFMKETMSYSETSANFNRILGQTLPDDRTHQASDYMQR